MTSNNKKKEHPAFMIKKNKNSSIVDNNDLNNRLKLNLNQDLIAKFSTFNIRSKSVS